MHSHHSHSGDFCQHAKGSLEACVEAASKKKLRVFCLTEHMPRLEPAHLYPEELESGTTVADLRATFEKYMKKAKTLRDLHKTESTKVLVGFEAEGIDAATLEYVQTLRAEFAPDLVVGSLHHVLGVPIDFSRELWDEAQAKAGSRQALLEAYFDEQYAMIDALRPTVVGHFDLIRLLSPDHDLSSVWDRVERNVELAVRHGSLFEINTAAIRKGWATPYPQPDVADLVKAKGGKFCLSCDSHQPAQVGQHLHEAAVRGYVAKYGPMYAADGSVVTLEEYDEWVKCVV